MQLQKNETWHKTEDNKILTNEGVFVCNCKDESLTESQISKNQNLIENLPTMIRALTEAQEIINKYASGNCFAVESILNKIEVGE